MLFRSLDEKPTGIINIVDCEIFLTDVNELGDEQVLQVTPYISAESPEPHGQQRNAPDQRYAGQGFAK